jgi:hypothetical protein
VKVIINEPCLRHSKRLMTLDPSVEMLGYKMNRAYGFALETELENEKI